MGLSARNSVTAVRRRFHTVAAWATCAAALGGAAHAADWPQWRGPDRNGISTETGWLDAWPPVLEWTVSLGEGYSCASVSDGRLYTMGHTNGQDVVYCLDALTGEQAWTSRLKGNFAASLLCADGRVYCFSREGETTVFRAARTEEVLARNSLESGFMASPAVAGDAFILRTKTHLYRIEDSPEIQ